MAEPKKIYVHAAAAVAPHSIEERRPLAGDPDIDLRPLVKRVLGQNLRQASHFVELAAVGARLCLDRLGHPPVPQTALYLGTGLGEVRRTESLFQQVLPPGPGIAAPFDFINATANMAAFYVARLAGLNARNLTVTQGAVSFESALQLALDDLRAGAVPAALVGGVDENYFPRKEYLRRWPLRDDEIMGEGSAWLYLSLDSAGALAELESVQWLPTGTDFIEALSVSLGEPLTLVCAHDVENVLPDKLPHVQWQTYAKYCGSYPTAAAFGVASVIEKPAPGRWVHVNRSPDGATVLVCWRIS